MKKQIREGFSIIEIILAAVLFVIFASGSVSIIIRGLDMNRLGSEQTIANQYASEGLEAIRSIRNQSFSNLTNSLGTGVIKTGNVWAFSGVNNTFNKYTRIITISDVYRDSNGNIVSSGGILDSRSKKVTSTVTWNVLASRNNSVVLSAYLTDWKTPITTPTPTPTNVPTPTPSPTPTPDPFVACTPYCQSKGYATGTCRANSGQCATNSEVYQSGGDTYCPISRKRCCCK
jgi:Tfp pilus assembly protein PilV